jgi:hypothetical protein
VRLLACEKVLRVRDNEHRSPILAVARSQERGAIIMLDTLLNLELDWAWTDTPETHALLKLAVERNHEFASGPPHYRLAAESALARLLSKHVSYTENEEPSDEYAGFKSARMSTLQLPPGCENVSVPAAFAAFGLCANSQDAAFWKGVERNVSIDRLLKGACLPYAPVCSCTATECNRAATELQQSAPLHMASTRITA